MRRETVDLIATLCKFALFLNRKGPISQTNGSGKINFHPVVQKQNNYRIHNFSVFFGNFQGPDLFGNSQNPLGMNTYI